MFARLTGVDVSYYQGSGHSPPTTINWTSVKNAGKTFAYIRATYGNSSDDADITVNAPAALAAGLYVGFYHYAYYDLAGHPATTEADNFFDKVKPYLTADGKHLQPVLDVEEGATVADGGTLSTWVNAWCDRVSSRAQSELGLSVTPMVYVSASPAGSYFDSSIPLNRPLWVAQYPGSVPDVQTAQPSGNGIWQNGTSPSYYNSWAFWQYSSTVTVSGISGGCDVDVFQGDLAQLQDYVIGGAGRFADGTRVKTGVALNVWDTGSANGTVLGSEPAGGLGTIVSGPIYGNSFMRWQVNFDDGKSGWVADYQTVNSSSPYTPIEWLSGPVVTSVSSTAVNGSYKAGSVIPITVTFDRAATVTGTPQLVLDVGLASPVKVNYTSGSGTTMLTFNYTVAAGQTSSDLDYDDASDSLQFNNLTSANKTFAIKDSLGNYFTTTLPAPGAAGSLAANKNLVIDTTAPTITNVTSSLANGTYPIGTVIPIQVTFAEAVLVSGAPLLALNTGGSATYASGSGSTTLTFNYTVGAGQSTGDLDYSSTAALTLNGGTIRDAATNNATLTLAAPAAAGSLGANKALVIDGIAPAITNVTSTAADGTYTAGAMIPITIQFNDVVNVTGTPQLTLNSGAVVNYSSGSGTNTLTFNYTVAAGQNSSDLDYSSTSALALSGGTIRDAATNNANLALAATGASGSLGFNKSIVVDTAAPSATYGNETPTNGNASVDFTITYADALSGVSFSTLDSNDITISGPNGFTAAATFVSVDVASNGSPRVATYRFSAPGGTWDVADNGSYTISQVAGQVSDVAGNSRSAGTIGTMQAGLPFAYVLGSTLHVQYAPGASAVTFTTDGSNNLVATENAASLSFAPGTFGDVVVHGSANADGVVISTNLSKPLTFDGQTGSDTITISSGGSYTFASDAAAMSADLGITIDSGGAATFSAAQHLSGLTVNGTASVTGALSTIVARALAVGGTLDLNANSLVVDYSGSSPIGSWNGSAYTGVAGLVQSGRNGGSWDGTGIKTSSGDSLHALGAAEASDVLGISGSNTAVFAGQTVDATSVLVKYTYAGDANLDGKLNVDDYTRLDFNVPLASTGWFNGDFNDDGKLNVDDYTIIDFNTPIQGAPL
jgi:GH25 family lysozyme M1 (1,4-beta-N-acetylmuramidase)